MAAMEAVLAARRAILADTKPKTATATIIEKMKSTLAPPVSMGPATGNGYEIMLQAFNWESHKMSWYKTLKKQVRWAAARAGARRRWRLAAGLLALAAGAGPGLGWGSGARAGLVLQPLAGWLAGCVRGAAAGGARAGVASRACNRARRPPATACNRLRPPRRAADPGHLQGRLHLRVAAAAQ
jgi:hypothetical protein